MKRWGIVAMREGCRRNVEQPVSEMVRVGELLSMSMARWGVCDWAGAADLVLVNCLTWEDALLRELAAHAERLAPGAFVLSTRRLPSAAFDVLEELTCPMSWGEAVLFVHRRSGDA